MKKCPFCAEEIQEDACKCKHCGEWLSDPSHMAAPQRAALPQNGRASEPISMARAIVISLIVMIVGGILYVAFDSGAQNPQQTVTMTQPEKDLTSDLKRLEEFAQSTGSESLTQRIRDLRRDYSVMQSEIDPERKRQMLLNFHNDLSRIEFDIKNAG